MLKYFAITIALLLGSLSLSASPSQLLFDSSGKKRDVSELASLGDAARWYPYRLRSDCPNEADKVCFTWTLKLPPTVAAGTSLANQIRDLVSSSILQWSHSSGIQIEAQFGGFSSDSDIPYLLSGSGEILRDDFDNPQVTPGFLVSFSSPANEDIFLDQEKSKLLQFFRPDLDSESAEVLWTGIYFNEAFHPWGNCNASCLQAFSQTQYSLRAVLIHQIGRAFGLAAHSNPSSTLYPVFSPSRNGSLTQRMEDRQALGSHYRNSAFLGSLKGKLIDGSTGTGTGGVEILLLREENRDSYAENANWTNISRMQWTDSEGHFSFEGLTPGNYLVMSYSPLDLLQNRAFYDEWVQASSAPYSSPNFYDGQGYESNREPSFYSPRLVVLAASLEVVAGEETLPVEMISSDLDGTADLIEAVGANRETIPDVDREDILSRIRENLEQDQQNFGSAGGGCQMGAQGSSSILIILIGLFLSLLSGFRYFRFGLDHPSR